MAVNWNIVRFVNQRLRDGGVSQDGDRHDAISKGSAQGQGSPVNPESDARNTEGIQRVPDWLDNRSK